MRQRREQNLELVFGPPGGGRGPGPSPRADWNETVVAVGRGAEGFDVSPDGKEVWVANAQDGTISIIDPNAKTVTQQTPATSNGDLGLSPALARKRPAG